MAAPALADRPRRPHTGARVSRKALLALEILAAYVRCRTLISRRDLPATLSSLRSRTGRSPMTADRVEAGARLGSATGRLLEAVPADDRCLMRALVLTRLLDRRGIASRLVIGVRPAESFGAHAWIEIAGHPVLESGGEQFVRLTEL